jgi:hypothetical protein
MSVFAPLGSTQSIRTRINAPSNTLDSESSPSIARQPFKLSRTQLLASRIVYEVEGPRAPAGAPVWNPLAKRRETVLRYRMRPEPVVFLLLAFSPQLTIIMSVCC